MQGLGMWEWALPRLQGQEMATARSLPRPSQPRFAYLNGDDFDEAGFEAVMEYVWTGQVSSGPWEPDAWLNVRR